jgi:GxxExxY protein
MSNDDDLTHDVIGAAIEVHKRLGPGYLEQVYEEALAVELELRNIEFERQQSFSLDYKSHEVGAGRLDMLVEGQLVLELKTVGELARIHKAQVISYLKALDCRLGLLVNFNVPVLKDGLERVVYD